MNKYLNNKKRATRVRKKLKKVRTDRYRLCIHRSSRNIYAQIIDDTRGQTLASASSREKAVRESISSGGSSEAAKVVGRQLAERAKAANITAVVFDRGGRLFHGRVKALADASREGGLNF